MIHLFLFATEHAVEEVKNCLLRINFLYIHIEYYYLQQAPFHVIFCENLVIFLKLLGILLLFSLQILTVSPIQKVAGLNNDQQLFSCRQNKKEAPF